jgi:pimeloyl-[acyl-carrier protein] methyl ester esterase
MMTPLNKHHLVFMPGLDGTGLSFEPLLPLLAKDTKYTIVRYPTDKLLSFREIVECAVAQIPVGDPPVVIAESFSGPVAVWMIASGKTEAKALVLCATCAASPHPLLWRIVRLLKLPLLIRPDMPKMFFRIVIGDDKLITELGPLWKKVHADVPARIMAHRLSILNNMDITAELGKLRLPCLYLQATKDRIVPSSCLKDFSRGIGHLKVKLIKAPHFILQARPQECIRAIEEFLELSIH